MNTRLSRNLVGLAIAAAAAAGPSAAGGPVPAAAAQAHPVARLELRDLDGKSRSLRQLRGKVVVVNFWATWCAPCIAEMPVLADLAERYGERGLAVVAASVDSLEDRDQVKEFARRRAGDVQVWVGASASDMEALGLPGDAVPATLLIDRGGRIMKRGQGAVGRGDLDPLIEMLLQRGGRPGLPDNPHRLPHPQPRAPGVTEAAAVCTPLPAVPRYGRSL